MTDDGTSRIEVGSCSGCGRALRVKQGGLRPSVRLTCKCGHVNDLEIDQATLARHGVLRAPVKEDIYQTSGVPLFRLLDGPRLRAIWAEVESERAERLKDLPRWSWPAPSDIISVAINPYASEENARTALKTLVERVERMDRARPWSVELFENVERSTRGILDARYFVVLGMTEIGGSGAETYDALKLITPDLRSDDMRARSGGEWEVWSQSQGNQWRGDRCARLLERWIFLDVDSVETYRAQQSAT